MFLVLVSTCHPPLLARDNVPCPYAACLITGNDCRVGRPERGTAAVLLVGPSLDRLEMGAVGEVQERVRRLLAIPATFPCEAADEKCCLRRRRRQ